MPQHKTESVYVPSRKIILIPQAILCLLLAFLLLFMTFLPTVAQVLLRDIPVFFIAVLRWLMPFGLALLGVYYVAKSFCCHLIITEENLEIHRVFYTTLIPSTTITSFIWQEETVRFAGLIPLFRYTLCTVHGSMAEPLIVLSTLEYANLKESLTILEVALQHE